MAARRYFPMRRGYGVHVVREAAYKGRTGTFLYGLCGVWADGARVTERREGKTICKSCWKIICRDNL
jgi:hypothetical protein